MRHEVFPIDGPKVRGQAARARVELRCEVRQGTRPWKLARLIDLSETGFRVAWLPEYDASKPLRIRIPGIEGLSAKVCWQEGSEVGCQFENPLHVAVFEHIARLAGGESR